MGNGSTRAEDTARMDAPLSSVDQERFTSCWTQAQPAVARYIASLVPGFQEAEDALQNVAVVLLRKFAVYDPQQPFIGWALGIARYEVLNHRRGFARNRLLFTPDLAEQASEVYQELLPELDERHRALRECLAGVGERTAQVLRLRYQEALEPKDIATRIGMTSGAIRVMLNRVRGSLLGCIERRLALRGDGA
jgi:RNA polymerase sigma-70 factor (ECF subfamily)